LEVAGEFASATSGGSEFHAEKSIPHPKFLSFETTLYIIAVYLWYSLFGLKYIVAAFVGFLLKVGVASIG